MVGVEESNELLKGADWKTTLGNSATGPGDGGPVVKKRLPKKLRQVPDYYFLPRKSIPYYVGVYGGFIAAGIGAGILVEVWINKKIKVGVPQG